MKPVEAEWGNPQLIWFHLFCIHPSFPWSPWQRCSWQPAGFRKRLKPKYESCSAVNGGKKVFRVCWDSPRCTEILPWNIECFFWGPWLTSSIRVKPLHSFSLWNVHVQVSSITADILFSPIKLWCVPQCQHSEMDPDSSCSASAGLELRPWCTALSALQRKDPTRGKWRKKSRTTVWLHDKRHLLVCSTLSASRKQSCFSTE